MVDEKKVVAAKLAVELIKESNVFYDFSKPLHLTKFEVHFNNLCDLILKRIKD